MGFNLCKRGSRHFKNCRRPCGSALIRTAYGHIKGTLRQIRRQNFAKEINSDFVRRMHCGIFNRLAFADTGTVAYRLFDLRILRWNYVAGDFLDFICNAHQGRHGDVCPACTRRRPRLHRRPEYCRICIIGCKQQPKNRNFGCHPVPCNTSYQHQVAHNTKVKTSIIHTE